MAAHKGLGEQVGPIPDLARSLDLARRGLRCRAQGCRAVFGRSGDQASITMLRLAAADRADHELRAHGLRTTGASEQPPMVSERTEGIAPEAGTADAPEAPMASLDEHENVVRDRILALLGRHGPATFEKILAQLEAPEAVVRSQLKVLIAGRLVRLDRDRSPGRGRPRSVYALTETTADIVRRQYDALADELLLDARAARGEDLIAQIFRQRHDRLEARYRQQFMGKPLRERVQEIARLLGQNGETVRWRQVDARTFLITKRDCSIFHLGRGGTACGHELTLLTRLLEAAVRREEHLADGHAACSYVITEAKAPKRRGSVLVTAAVEIPPMRKRMYLKEPAGRPGGAIRP